MGKILIAIFLFLLLTPVFADAVDLHTKVDKDRITIGDRITYEVALEYADGIEIEPLSIAENLGEFELKDYSIEEPKKIKGGNWQAKTSYIITTWTTGEWTIPPIKVKYRDLNGKENEVSSKEIKIYVESVQPRPEDKDDIRPLKEPTKIKQGFLVLGLILLILLSIGGLLIFIYFRRKKKISNMPPLPFRSPEEIAMEELGLLLEMRLVEKGMVKEYYIRISDIVRKLIEGRFMVFALDMTTWELYQEMKDKKFERSCVDEIRDFLEECDLVKFARYVPAQKETEEVYNKAKKIVELSTSQSKNGHV